MKGWWMLVAALASMAGCAGSAPPITYYARPPAPLDVGSCPVGPIEVGDLSARPAALEPRLALRREGPQVVFFNYHAWVGTPVDVLRAALEDGLAAGACPPAAGLEGLRVEADLVAFEGRLRGRRCTADVAIDLRARRRADQSLLGAWRLSAVEPCEVDRPDTIAAGLVRALEKAVAEGQTRIAEALRAAREDDAAD